MSYSVNIAERSALSMDYIQPVQGESLPYLNGYDRMFPFLQTVKQSQDEQQRQETVRRLMAEVFLDDRLDDEYLQPFRTVAAWRIIRRMAHLHNKVNHGQLMAEAIEREEDWYAPVMVNVLRKESAQLQDLFNEATRLPDNHRLMEISEDVPIDLPLSRVPDHKIRYSPGIPLMPPRPTLFPTRIRLPQNSDWCMNLWVRIMWWVIDDLKIDTNEFGQMGIKGMKNAAQVAVNFPERGEILAWEEMIADQTIKALIEHGLPKTREMLSSQYGLVQREITDLMVMAKARMVPMALGETQDERALMVLRTEDFIQRSRTALDLRAEMMGMKHLAAIHGLAREIEGDSMDDFIGIVRSAAVSREKTRQPVEIAAAPARPLLVEHSGG